MSTINKVILIGNLGADPEIKTFDNGGKIATFSIATTEKWKNKDGSPGEHIEWHDVKISFPNIVDVVQKYVKKGTKVYIEGKLRTESWEKEGVKNYRTWVYAGGVTMLGGNTDNGNTPTNTPKTDSTAPTIAEDEDDDLPF